MGPLETEYYDFVLERVTALPLAKRIVYSVAADLRDRRGIRHEWEQVDEDIKEEIWETLIQIVERELADN